MADNREPEDRFRVHMIGTGAGTPTPLRGVSCTVVQYGNDFIMVDCGEGTQLKLLDDKCLVKPTHMPFIFLTHLHGDHLFGLPGLLMAMESNQRTKPITIFGPKDLLDRLGPIFAFMGKGQQAKNLKFPVFLQKIEPGQSIDYKALRITAVRTSHGKLTRPGEHDMPAQGYLFQEYAVDTEMAREQGVPPAEVESLVRGKKVAVAGLGTFNPADFYAPVGRSVLITGDTRSSPDIIEAARGVDVLIHESTFISKEFKGFNGDVQAGKTGHSTPTEAAQVALEAGVGKLVLYHFSTRYDKDNPEALFLDEAKQTFSNVVYSKDGMIINLEKKGQSFFSFMRWS